MECLNQKYQIELFVNYDFSMNFDMATNTDVAG